MVEFKRSRNINVHLVSTLAQLIFVKISRAFGAKGLRVTNVEEVGSNISRRFETEGPVIIDIPIDYRDNEKLGRNDFTRSIFIRRCEHGERYCTTGTEAH